MWENLHSYIVLNLHFYIDFCRRNEIVKYDGIHCNEDESIHEKL